MTLEEKAGQLNPRERILRCLLRSQRALRIYIRGSKILRSLLRRVSICHGFMCAGGTVFPEDLSLFDKYMNEAVEPGVFDIIIGSSSEDIRLKGKLTLKLP